MVKGATLAGIRISTVIGAINSIHWVESVPPDCDIIWRFTCRDCISIEAQNDIYFFHPRGSLKVFRIDSNFFGESHSRSNVQMKS